MSYAADALDIGMEKYLTKPNGYYIEAGAFNGLAQSNTKLYADRGWTGILIEPVPHLHQQLVANRPKDDCLHCALVGNPDTKEILLYCCEFMSVVQGARGSEAEDRGWVREGCVAQGIPHVEVMVPARTLASILEERGSPHVDFLSLDIEGGEWEALRGLNLDVHRPDFMLVELSRLIPETVEWVKSQRYELVENLTHRDFVFRAL